MRSKLRKRSVSETIVFSFVFVIFSVMAFTYIYLVAWCFYSGMRSNVAIAKHPFGLDGLQIKNYIDVFSLLNVKGYSFFGMILNSLWFSFLGPMGGIFVTSMMAYVTSKYKFPGSHAVYFIVLIVITLPIYGSQSAMYRLLYNTGLLNTRWMIITSFNGFSIYYMYFYAFFCGMSWTYGEAAEIDGANDWQIYFRIMFPQSLPMVGSLFLMSWITEWNSYGSALMYLSDIPTLAVGIYKFYDVALRAGGRMDLLYAGCFISILPPLIMFILCNNALMSNVSLGGIKE